MNGRPMKHNRIVDFSISPRVPAKDSEGGTYTTFGDPKTLTGEVWPGSGRAQALQYGERLDYIVNVRIREPYTVIIDSSKRLKYRLSDGFSFMEMDRIMIDGADYKIITIKPFKPLLLTAEKI